MWVVPISTLLDSDTMTEFMPHEEMKRKGLLVEWKPSLKGRVLFCSHTWLRSNSPDNEAGQKFCLLKTLLSRVRAGKFSCGPDWQSELVYGKDAKKFSMKSADLKRDLSEGYVFFE